MERILEFTVRKTNGKPRILRLENGSECMQNAAFCNVNRSFSKRVNATFFAVRESLGVGVEVALFVIVVSQQLCGLGNIVQCDQKYRILFCDEGLNVGAVQRMNCLHMDQFYK